MKGLKYIQQTMACAGLLALVACGGGTSSGTSSSSASDAREITGSLTSSSAALSAATLSNAAADSCPADTVIATAATGMTTTADVQDDCSFDMDLEVDNSYVLSFTLNETFVATLLFDSGVNGFSTSAMGVSSGNSAVDLGIITFSGTTALATNNPLAYMDRDGDGISDLEDSDDDDDGIADADERDCDYDGYLDDDEDDDDLSNCTTVDGEYVRRVKPFDGNDEVDLEKDVKIYLSCAPDMTTVDADSFQVISENDEQITCDYQLSDDDEENQIRCRHRDDPFMADTTYTVTVSGITCEDSSEVADVEWSFSTEVQDDDSGDAEDEFDDELENSGSNSSDDGEDNSGDDNSDDSEDDSSDDSGDDSEDD